MGQSADNHGAVIRENKLPGLWWLISLGVLFRLRRYLDLRSVWGDEAAVARNLLERGYWELLEPLDYRQAAPVLFLWLQKLVVSVLGHHEWTLRLLPLLLGCVSLVLFGRFLQRYHGGLTGSLALLFFVISEPLIHFSAEAKQYSADVFATLVIFCVVDWQQPARPHWRNAWLGALLLWFSHPVVFILGGWGVAGLISALRNQQWQLLRRWVALGLIWGGSLLLHYLIVLQNTSNDDYLRTFWQSAFLPWSSLEQALNWFGRTLLDMFHDPGGWNITWLAALLAGFGLLRRLGRSPSRGLILVSPILLALTAAAFHLYPFPTQSCDRGFWHPADTGFFLGRLVLFIVPALYTLTAMAIGPWLDSASKPRRALALLMASLVLLAPLQTLAQTLVHPPKIQEMRNVVLTLQERHIPGQQVYTPEFLEDYVGYFEFRYDAPFQAIPLTTLGPRKMVQQLSQSATGDFWFLIADHEQWPDFAERIQSILEVEFLVLDRIAGPHAAALLCRAKPTND